MQPWEFKVPTSDIKVIRRSVHRIFDRMVMTDDEFYGVVNNLENAARDWIRVGMIAISTLVFFGLGTGLRFWQPDIATRFPILQDWVYSLALSFGLAGGAYILLFRKPFQRWSEDLITYMGRYFVNTRKLRSAQEKRQPLLGATLNWMRTRPLHAVILFSRIHGGKDVDEVLSEGFVSKVRSIQDRESPGFLVLKKFAEHRPWHRYLNDWFRSPYAEGRTKRTKLKGFWGKITSSKDWNYFIRARAIRNALSMSVLFRLLNTEMRDELSGNLRWRRQYVTSRKQQVSAIFDSNDLPTRFRSNSPHYRWPVADNADSVGETSTYRAIQCIENPCTLPLYIIHARNILAQFDQVIQDFYEECRGDTEQALEARQERFEITIGKLTKTNVRMFGKFSHDSLQTTSEVGVESGPILKDLSLSAKENEDVEAILAEDRFRDWGLRWDPNRIDWHEINADQDGDTGRSFAILMEAIDRERKNAKQIILSRGDMLLVDNLRCLVARQEPPARTFFQSVFGIPQDWWLAGYYGFRQSMKSMREPFEERYRRLDDEASRDFAVKEKKEELPADSDTTAPASLPMMVRRR